MRILFSIRNGIGFGHIRRALVLADEICGICPKAQPVILAQAHSLELFRSCPYPVLNFPLLDRLPDNRTEQISRLLLDQILELLQPDLVVNDTHPDRCLLSSPAIRDVPKVLTVRRVDPTVVNEARLEGCLGLFDRVVFLQSREEFLTEQSVPELRVLAHHCDRFHFTGAVYKKPDEEEINQVRIMYGQNCGRLIVVSAGAGGEHIGEGYCERLFSCIGRIARNFRDRGRPERFVIVVGPYYRGAAPENGHNVEAITFDQRLPALLSVADVVVARPGYNVVHEALSGTAQLVLVPGISHFERQRRWVSELRTKYGVFTCEMLDQAALESAIDMALANPVCRSRPEQANAAVAHHLLAAASGKRFGHAISPGVFLSIGGCSPRVNTAIERALAAAGISDVCLIADGMPTHPGHVPTVRYLADEIAAAQRDLGSFQNAAFGSSLADAAPGLDDIVALGITALLYTDDTAYGFDGRSWPRHHQPISRGVLPVPLTHVNYGSAWLAHLEYRLARSIAASAFPLIYLCCERLAEEDAASLARSLKEFLTRSGVTLLSLSEVLARCCAPLLLEGLWSPEPLASEFLQ